MKSNQLMTVAFSGGKVNVLHNTAMGSLTDIWSAGNACRLASGKSVANMSKFLKTTKTKEFIEICEKASGSPCYQVTGKGRNRQTWASIHLMIYTAEFLDLSFHYEVIDAFVKGEILKRRDEGGDMFKELNNSINTLMLDRIGKNNRGMFIQTAKRIAARISPENGDWNLATANDLKDRIEIESRLNTAIKMGWIKTKDDLWDAIDKI